MTFVDSQSFPRQSEARLSFGRAKVTQSISTPYLTRYAIPTADTS